MNPLRSAPRQSLSWAPDPANEDIPTPVQAPGRLARTKRKLPVGTLAASAVLVAFNWPERSVRYKRLEAFVTAFFDKIDQFQQAPRHPKWREVNLAAQVPGWVRFDHTVRPRQGAG